MTLTTSMTAFALKFSASRALASDILSEDARNKLKGDNPPVQIKGRNDNNTMTIEFQAPYPRESKFDSLYSCTVNTATGKITTTGIKTHGGTTYIAPNVARYALQMKLVGHNN